MLHALVILPQRYEAKHRHLSVFLDQRKAMNRYPAASLTAESSGGSWAQLCASTTAREKDFRQTLSAQGLQTSSCLKSPLGLWVVHQSGWGEHFCVGGSVQSFIYFQERKERYFLFPCLPPHFPSAVLRWTGMRLLAESQQKVSGSPSLEAYSCCSEKAEICFNWRPWQEERQGQHFSTCQGSHSWHELFLPPRFQILVNFFQASLGLRALMLELCS